MSVSCTEWEAWLQGVTDEEVSGFAKKAHRWAEEAAYDYCNDLTCFCVSLFDGDHPRTWLKEAYEAMTISCLSEEEAIQLLVRLYEDIMVR
jgi:hypothetical protein